MATFKPVVRTNNEFNSVFIRISSNSKTDYIKTSMIIHKSGIIKNEITDYSILGNCYIQIKKYVERLANINTELWTAAEIKKFLLSDSEGISFTDFANSYIGKLINNNREQSAENYSCALNSLKKFLGKNDFLFSDITSNLIRKWIESLLNKSRAKELYPVCIRKMFDEGCLTHNDYDRNIIRIINNPFKAVTIPKSNAPKKRSIKIDVIHKILRINPEQEREKLAHDIILMVLYLAGINTIDLYKAEKHELKNGKLCYNRSKTKTKRSDNSYFEISVPSPILPLIEKYAGKKYLFNFRDRFSTSKNFFTSINKGLEMLCKKVNENSDEKIPKITVYWLRHTWATIAQNKCGFNIEQVAFGLNHTSAHKVTEGYIEKDFSQVDKINEKVCSYIFNA